MCDYRLAHFLLSILLPGIRRHLFYVKNIISYIRNIRDRLQRKRWGVTQL